ncbi:MAG TPA: 16S rRNA (guanine(527)-N(7))-methyltransferase RsmG [Mycobacteriales bacterium]|nr:16S rRNA (guanine(527)-N(7))-methyltransferase RsmG [Mycobacteriales bacterium]
MQPAPGGAADLRVAVERGFGERADLATRYADLLCTAGIERGLIGPREADRIWDRHLFNSVALAPLIAPDATVVDLGSGAGLPGIPVALARPDLKVILVEPMARRVAFLRECVDTLGLERVEIHYGRAPDDVPRGEVVVARAVAALPSLAELALTGPNRFAELIALKGASVHKEVAEVRGEGRFEVEVVVVTDPAGASATVARVRRAR